MHQLKIDLVESDIENPTQIISPKTTLISTKMAELDTIALWVNTVLEFEQLKIETERQNLP